MAAKKDKLNGSVGRLAKALGDVVMESMQIVKKEMKVNLEASEKRLMQRMDTRFDGFEKSMQGQFDRFKERNRG